MNEKGFSGFSREFIDFYDELKVNNEKVWFDENKHRYERYVLKPAKKFVSSMDKMLKNISPELHGIPKVNKSIFRIYRDVRFSQDKTPYKTNLGLWFWEGERKRTETTGFYMFIDPPSYGLGAGIYRFTKDILNEFRESLTDRTEGREFKEIITKYEDSNDYTIGGDKYKRVPKGYDRDSLNAEYLKHKSMWINYENLLPGEFYTAEFLQVVYTRFEELKDFFFWTKRVVDRTD